MQAMHARFNRSMIAVFHKTFVDILPRFLHQFFDAARMNTAVGNQLLQRNFSYLTPDRIEARQHHHLRGIVNQHLDAGRRFEHADVAPFPADDAAFDVVARQRHHRHRALGHVIDRGALHGFENDILGGLMRLHPRFIENFFRGLRGFVPRNFQIVVELNAFRFFVGQSGDLLEAAILLEHQALKLLLPRFERLLAPMQRLIELLQFPFFAIEQIHFAVEIALAPRQLVFYLLNFTAAVFDFLFKLLAFMKNLLLNFQLFCFLQILRFLPRLSDNLLHVRVGTCNFITSKILAQQPADIKANHPGNRRESDRDADVHYSSVNSKNP